MRSILKILLTGLILFGLQGCYTILWTPEKTITEDYEYETVSYYSGYAPEFYDTPWWIYSPVIGYYPHHTSDGNKINDERNKDRDLGTIRDNDGGRNPGGRNPEIIPTPPPTTSTPGSTGSGSTSGSTNSGSTVRTESSGNSSSGSGNRSSDTRNNSGNRNSGSGRK